MYLLPYLLSPMILQVYPKPKTLGLPGLGWQSHGGDEQDAIAMLKDQAQLYGLGFRVYLGTLIPVPNQGSYWGTISLGWA